jgi:hypothetical protein
MSGIKTEIKEEVKDTFVPSVSMEELMKKLREERDDLLIGLHKMSEEVERLKEELKKRPLSEVEATDIVIKKEEFSPTPPNDC